MITARTSPGVARSSAGAASAPRHGLSAPLLRAARPHRLVCKPLNFKESDKPATGSTPPPPVIPTPLPRPSGTGTPITAGNGTPMPASTVPGFAPVPGPTTRPPVVGVAVSPFTSSILTALSWAAGVLAAACLILPGKVAEVLLKASASSVSAPVLVAAAGATLLPTLLTKHYLKEACNTGMVGTPLANQMTGSVLSHSLLSFLILAQAQSLRLSNPPLALTVGVLSGLGLLVSAYIMQRVHPWGLPAPKIKGLAASALSLISPKGLASTAYAAISLSLLFTGASLLGTGPDTGNALLGSVLPISDPLSVFTARNAGAGLISAGIMALGLKEAADRALLAAPMARWLNLGLAAMGGIMAVALWTGMRVGAVVAAHPATTIAWGQAALAAFALAMYLRPPMPSTTVAPLVAPALERNAPNAAFFEYMAQPYETVTGSAF